MICDIVCLPPHAQNGSSRMPQSYRVSAQRPWPVRYRLRIVQSLLLRSKPGWRMIGSVTRTWLAHHACLLSRPRLLTSQNWALQTISDVWMALETQVVRNFFINTGRFGHNRILSKILPGSVVARERTSYSMRSFNQGRS